MNTSPAKLTPVSYTICVQLRVQEGEFCRAFNLRKAFEKSGLRGYPRRKLETTRDDPYISGQINPRLGNRDEAFRWLEKACEQRSGFVALLEVDPELDNLHSDPRFPNPFASHESPAIRCKAQVLGVLGEHGCEHAANG